MMKNLTNIMENFTLNEYHQKCLDDYFYPEYSNYHSTQKNTPQFTPENDLQKEQPLHISDLAAPNQSQNLFNPNDLPPNQKQIDNETGTTRPLIIFSNNKPITTISLNLEVSEIKSLNQSSHMLINDQTIYDLSSNLESNQLLDRNVTWDS